MSVRINFVNHLPDNIIPYEDNYVDLRHVPWYDGYLNSLYAGFSRDFPPAWHNYMCGNYWDIWHDEPFNHEDYLADNIIQKGGLNK